MKRLVLLALVMVGGCVPDLWPVAAPMVRATHRIIPAAAGPLVPARAR